LKLLLNSRIFVTNPSCVFHFERTVVTIDLEGLTIDDLFTLHTELSAVLTEKLIAKKDALDKRLRRLHSLDDREITRARRPYPPVKTKFRNPDQPLETWSGRGKRPCWLIAQLKSGKRIDDLRIAG